MEILLSLIIPGYERYEYADRLLEKIDKQIQKKVEVILIDDGSPIPYNYKYDWLKIIRLKENSGGASVPRNAGLDVAKGKYIAFIDIDDTIAENYISTILAKIETEDFDYCYFSWQTTDYTIIIDDIPPAWNCCVWDCVYKKEIIGENRFDPKFKMAEDADFNNRVRKGKKAIIPKVLYHYNKLPRNSLTQQGQLYNEKFTKEVM